MKYCYILFIFVGFNLTAQVSPLLSTTWNQTCHYNAQMPTVSTGGSCGKAFTGYNATAMAQICKYYEYPISGFGNHCNTNSPSNCADFSLANYDYSAMPNNVTSANINVATLMYDLGVSVDMNWSGTNSTSFFSSSVLKEYFAYSPKMYSSATFLFPTTADLIEAIKLELDNGRPVYAKGGGHFFLIDGYNLSDNFHMNFGWGGTYDGYYAINNVVNGAGTFTPSNFIFNIMPLQGDLETAKDTIYIGASGVSSEALEFTSLSDWTASSSQSWIIPNLTSGSKGFFNSSDGSHFAASLNNGNERIGYLLITNVSTVDTVVIVQAPSTLQVTPDTLHYMSLGGTESIVVEHNSFTTWNVTATAPWLSLSTNSGTGNGGFDVIATMNPGASRSAYVITTGGGFTDSIFVMQEENESVGLLETQVNTISLYPNPVKDKLIISNLEENKTPITYDLLGNLQAVKAHHNGDHYILDFSNLRTGIYFIKVDEKLYRVLKN